MKENYRTTDQVNVYEGNLRQMSDVLVSSLAPAKAEHRQRGDASRRQLWLRAPLCRCSPPAPLSSGQTPGASGARRAGQGRQGQAAASAPQLGQCSPGLRRIASRLLSSAPALQPQCQHIQDPYSSARFC